MFTVAITLFKPTPVQLGCQSARRQPFENVFITDFDAGDSSVQRRAVQVSLECLDLGQLWHRACMNSAMYSFNARALLCVVSFAPKRSVTVRFLDWRTSSSTSFRCCARFAAYFFLYWSLFAGL